MLFTAPHAEICFSLSIARLLEKVYLLDAGSTVVDVIGHTDDYNFDFVNDAANLTMTVGGETLKTPKTEPGTYGQYDQDGSQGYDGLYTNNSATLYPVDSNGTPMKNKTPAE